jgi:hypothetical protein
MEIRTGESHIQTLILHIVTFSPTELWSREQIYPYLSLCYFCHQTSIYRLFMYIFLIFGLDFNLT